jgi:hypothetical protein
MYQALRATSETLKRFLDNQLAMRGLTSTVSLKTPTEMDLAATHGLSVWLYRAVRDDNRLNDAPIRTDPLHERKPPLPMRLHYLMTPIGLSPEVEQELLGIVLQAFHDHPVLRGSDLFGAFTGGPYELSVRLEQLTLEEITRAWEALQSAYQLSLSYEVSVVPIDSTLTASGAPVTVLMADAELIVAPEVASL